MYKENLKITTKQLIELLNKAYASRFGVPMTLTKFSLSLETQELELEFRSAPEEAESVSSDITLHSFFDFVLNKRKRKNDSERHQWGFMFPHMYEAVFPEKVKNYLAEQHANYRTTRTIRSSFVNQFKKKFISEGSKEIKMNDFLISLERALDNNEFKGENSAFFIAELLTEFGIGREAPYVRKFC